MKIPLSLIRSFVEIDVPLETICNQLTLLGIEVDSCINPLPPFSGVVVGEVLSTKPHPNAEKLQIAQVDYGKGTLSVVCGAENCRPGIKTAFAMIGALLSSGESAPRQIAKTSIRGAESNGMLCSAEELSLWKDSSGILELPQDWENGKDLLSLWDPILECSFTPNLGHCLSALGIARELAASLQKPIKLSSIKPSLASQVHKKIHVTVEDSKLCPRYMGRLIEGVTIAPSPFWLQKILLQCGMKPICNVVDITNFIMMQRGQPLHAFDADQIEGKKIHIAQAKSQEDWVGLDGIRREIPKGTLLISDEKKGLALAGILGGENSAVGNTTKNIFLEAAFFDPTTVRKNSKAMGIRTDSAIRFEKGIDPNGVALALEEATRLIVEICHGVPSGDPIDLYPHPIQPKTIPVRPERVNKLLGTKISVSEMEQIFRRLECQTKDTFIVSPPTYRFDLCEEIDLIEEVARIYGYNNIEKAPARSISSQISNDLGYRFETLLRARCVGQGLQEFLTSDLISPKMADLCVEIVNTKGMRLLKTLHAKTEEYSILRPSLLPGLLTVAQTNIDLKNTNWRAFEIGRIHFLQKGKCIEIPMLALLMTGMQAPLQWGVKKEEVDFYSLKGILENLLTSLHIGPISFHPSQHCSFHSGRQAEIKVGDLVIGTLGEIHPQMLAKADVKQRLLFAELNIEYLMQLEHSKAKFKTIPHLPSSERDWTLSIPTAVHIEKVFQAIQKHRTPILEKFELIDLYIPESQAQKNVTIRFTYRDLVKTVSFEEVEKEHSRLVEAVQKSI